MYAHLLVPAIHLLSSPPSFAMSRGSKRPSPDAEEDSSKHPPKRSRFQDDTTGTSQSEAVGRDKGKAREVIAPPLLTLDEVSARLVGLKCAQTSGEPTTSARAQQQAEEIAYLERVRRRVGAWYGLLTGLPSICNSFRDPSWHKDRLSRWPRLSSD